MTEYLLDTSVVSMLEPARGILTPELEAWFMIREPRVYLSTVTIFETMQGIAKLSLNGKLDRASKLTTWFDGLVNNFDDRIISLDLSIAEAAGRLSALALSNGNHPGVADIMIAGTAQARDMLLLTRNTRHFANLDIAIADPIVALPH